MKNSRTFNRILHNAPTVFFKDYTTDSHLKNSTGAIGEMSIKLLCLYLVQQRHNISTILGLH